MKQNEHEFTITARCPVQDCPDVYSTTVRTIRVIRVEDILAEVKKQTEKPVLQEELTERLSAALGCQVETVGVHSGVRTRSTYGDIA